MWHWKSTLRARAFPCRSRNSRHDSCHLPAARKVFRNSTATSTPPLWISLRHSTQSAETDCAKSWASLAAPQIHHYRSPVPWGHVRPSPWWWWTARFFPSLQRCKQGCVLAPTVLSLMSSAMLKGAFRDCDAGIRINHRSGHRLPKVSDSKTASRSLR